MSDPAEMSAACEPIGAYFDRELDDAATTAFEGHLVSCARCQAEIEDLMGFEAALRGRGASIERPAASPVAPRRRWLAASIAVGCLAVAAVIFLVVRPGRGGGSAPAAPALALAERRGVEVRFAAPAFDGHRPYAVNRGATAPEVIPLATLAALEQRGDHGGLIAAHALVAELGRADAVAATLPDTTAAAADRAALAVLRGQPEQALALTERALRREPGHAGAQWNRALALRDLELPMAAAAAFDAVAARGEPGWADEARVRAAGLRAGVTVRDRDFAALGQRAGAQIAGTRADGLTVADARRFPAFTRLYFLDALRVVDDADQARALGAVADELDTAAGDRSARLALEAVVASDFAVRRRFQARYRAVKAQALSAAEIDRLLAELAAAGASVADLQIGVLILSGQARPRRAELARLLGSAPSPWFALLLARERIGAARDDGRDVEAELIAALASCDAAVWAFRCAALELDLAEALGMAGRIADAHGHAARARVAYALAGAPDQEDAALVFQGELARHGGRAALASAIFDEVARRAAGRSCETERYGHVGLAVLALARGDLDAVRTALPAAGTCPESTDAQAVMTAVDLARQSGRDDDRVRAEAWLAAAAADPAADLATLAAIGGGRLAIDRDPAAGRDQIVAALPALASDEPSVAGIRAWAYAALLDDDGAGARWADALADAGRELGGELPPGCVVVASADDDRVVVAIRDSAGATGGALRRIPVAEQPRLALVPGPLLAALAGCPQIAVIARPPLQGRADLLPPDRPWFFVGERAARPPPPPATREVLVVTDPATAAPRLVPVAVAGARVLSGAEATPSRVLAALSSATYAELHVHGVADLAIADASYLLLAPDPGGGSVLTARDLRGATLRGAPIVVLAACRASDVAPHLQVRWSLPDAFMVAGARAVIAADVELPDDEAAALFAELRGRLDGGEAPAAALAAVRSRASGGRADHWAAHLMLFQPR